MKPPNIRGRVDSPEIFVHHTSRRDYTAYLLAIDSYATRLLAAQALSIA